MKKVIVLSRVSTEGQDLTQQTDEVLREVYKDGYTYSNIIIIEDKESAIQLSEEERHGLNKMKEYISTNPNINCVYIYELPRLSRIPLVLYSIRDYLVERRIQLICLKPYFRLLEVDGTMSQTGSLMFSLFSSLAESEMILKKERMMRGRRRKKELGRSVGGRPPFGYDLDKHKSFIVDPKNSLIISRIFNDYGYGNKSMKEIAVELKEEGYFANNELNTVRLKIQVILNRTIYKGEFPYPPIISEELFSVVQQNIKESSQNRVYRKKEPFLLKGLVCDSRTGYILSTNGAIETYFSNHHSGVAIRRNNIDPEIETLEGILIATTNLTANMDKAFERRFLYKVEFNAPTTEAKCAIWKSMIPSLSDEDARLLATEYKFSGGQIENIARKHTIAQILTESDITLNDIRLICNEELLDKSHTCRPIGF